MFDMNGKGEHHLNLEAHRLGKKQIYGYEVFLFHNTGRFFTALTTKKAKDVEKAIQKFVDYYRIPCTVKYFGKDKNKKIPIIIKNKASKKYDKYDDDLEETISL